MSKLILSYLVFVCVMANAFVTKSVVFIAGNGVKNRRAIGKTQSFFIFSLRTGSQRGRKKNSASESERRDSASDAFILTKCGIRFHGNT